jgi:hypothetical protein
MPEVLTVVDKFEAWKSLHLWTEEYMFY